MSGSLINMIMEQSASEEKPEVGKGVTVILYSDRSCGTIVEVSKSGKRFWYTRDNTRRIDTNGFSESQTYECTPDPEGHRVEVYKTRKGLWRERGGGWFIQLGCKRPYYDFTR